MVLEIADQYIQNTFLAEVNLKLEMEKLKQANNNIFSPI
jgi:hypothetical protein